MLSPDFLDAYEAARHNAAWYLSFAMAPLLLALPMAWWPRLSQWIIAPLFLVSMCTTAALSWKAIELKWDARHALVESKQAKTDEEAQLCMDDGANLMFAPVIGGFEGFAYSLLAVGAGTLLRRIRRRYEPAESDGLAPSENQDSNTNSA